MSTLLNNKAIFLTGATGFVGKAVLEKLLRSFNCKKIYLLIRGDANSKAETLKKSTVFDRLRADLGGAVFNDLYSSKVIPIQGDHEKVDIGLSEDQCRQISDTDVIIHVAASISFNLPFVEALSVNLLGSMRILELAKRFHKTNPNFVGLEYISTAFVNANYSNVPGGHPYVIKEDLYSFSIAKDGKEYKVDRLVDLVQESLPTLLRNERPNDLIMEYANVFTTHQWANTYTLTKHMTEKLLIKMRGQVPLVILRPAVIAASVEEPEPGWTESNAGLHAVMISMALGHLTQFPFVRNAAIDTVPVDYCAAAILEVGCYLTKNTKYHKKKGTGEFYRDDAHLPLVPIFHLSSGCNPMQWRDIVGGLESYFNVSPLKRSISSKISIKTTNEVENLRHHIATMVEQHKQTQDPIEKKKLAAEISITQKFHFFMTNSYQFESENLGEVRQDLQWALWNHNFSELDWHNYVRRVCYGLQKGVFKELSPSPVKL